LISLKEEKRRKEKRGGRVGSHCQSVISSVGYSSCIGRRAGKRGKEERSGEIADERTLL